MFSKLSDKFLVVFSLIFASTSAFGQPYLDLQGNFNYLLNRPPTKAMVLTPDNSIGIALTHVFEPDFGGRISSFNVATLAQVDAKFVGFGPRSLELTALPEGYRVVALTTRGGPRAITIYDMSNSGQFIFRAETQLTTSAIDEDSNPVLSARGRAGFVRVRNSQNNSEIVSFSLDNGAVLGHLPSPQWQVINIFDYDDQTLIVAGSGRDLSFIDVTNPSNMMSIGQVTLPTTGTSGSTNDLQTVFSNNGSVVFVGGDNAKLSAVDMNLRQVIGSIGEQYFTSRLAVIESGGSRWIAQYGGDNGNFIGLNLVNANALSAMSSVNQVHLGFEFFEHRDVIFTNDGSAVVLSSDSGLATFQVPSLTRVSTEFQPPTSFGFTVKTIGVPEYTIGTWGSTNSFSARIYAVNAAVSGMVTYGNAIGTPPRFVSNVLLSGAGTPNVSATSLSDGSYLLRGFGAGSYTVTPSKIGGVNGITSFDAAKIAQHAAGLNQLTGNQLIVADVSGNGTISSFDAGQIARYAAGLNNTGSTGTWKFIPVNRLYPPIISNIAGQDFGALLMGEVSGNWIDSPPRPR